MAVVSEFVSVFGFKGNINPLKDFNKELSIAIPKMTKFALTTSAVGAGIAKVITSKLVSDNPMVQFAHHTGESVKNIQALQLVSVQFGASLMSSFEATKSLSKALAEARLKGNEAFGQFGLTIVDNNNKLKNAQDILKDINKLFNSSNRLYGELADKRQKLIVLQTLGIKEDLLPLLMQTTEEYAKQLKINEQLTLSHEQVDSIREFNNELNKTSAITSQISSQVMAGFGDDFGKILKDMNDFLMANKDIVKSMSEMVLKIGLVAGVIGTLTIATKGLALVFSKMFLPVTIALTALEAFEQGAFTRLYNEIRGLPGGYSDRVKKTNDIQGWGEDARGVPLLDEDIVNPANINNMSPISNKNDVKLIQTNTFNIQTNNPQVMTKTIEKAVNKGAKLIQETSTRGGI